MLQKVQEEAQTEAIAHVHTYTHTHMHTHTHTHTYTHTHYTVQCSLAVRMAMHPGSEAKSDAMIRHFRLSVVRYLFMLWNHETRAIQNLYT